MSPEMNPLEEVLAGPTPVEAWRYDGRFGALASPLVRAGDRLIGTTRNKVFAIDIHTGEIASTGVRTSPEWEIELVSRISSEPHVTAYGGGVYLMDGQKLLAFHLSSAANMPSWKVPKEFGRVSRLLAREDRVIAVHASGKNVAVSGFHAATGEKLFGALPVAQHTAQCLTYGGGALFFVASRKLNAVNVQFGDQRWGFESPSDTLDPTVDPLVASSVVVAAGTMLHGVTLDRGEEKFTVAASDSSGSGFHWFAPIANIPNATAAATLAVNRKALRPLLGDTYGRRALYAAAEQAQSGTAIATNTAGDLICFSLADGKKIWGKRVPAPGAPVLIDGIVYVVTDGGTRLARFHAASGEAAGPAFDLPRLQKDKSVVIGNGSLFLSRDDGTVSAHAFALEHAAYFNGTSSVVKVPPERGQRSERGRFDFGAGDFTVEAWFRSSTGGEIVSSYPTSEDPAAHSFRLNLSETGQVRVGVLNRNGTAAVPGRTNHTFAADGEWHHVAFVRREGEYMIVLDGLSHEVRLPEGKSTAPLSIGGEAALTIGAFVPSAGAQPAEFFRGLIREVRVWDRAIDIATISTNRDVALTGLEPRLQGMWKLDEEQKPGAPIAPRNLASIRRTAAESINAASRVTDFALDHSAFPYLLHESAAQWPYAGTWGARGEQPMNGSAAISSDGIVAFSTVNSVYAVRAHDGARVWAMTVRRGSSEPAADGHSFLVMTPDESLVRIDARSGAKVEIEAFAAISTGGGTSCVRPAVSEQWIAACPVGDSTSVYLAERAAAKAHAASVAGGVVRALAFGEAGLCVLAEGDAGLTLNLIHPADRSSRGARRVHGPAFCMAGGSVFATSDSGVVKLDRYNLTGAPQAVSPPIASPITGLAESVAHNLIVATTASGEVYGLAAGTLVILWQTTLPGGTPARASRINPPIMDSDGRVLCTTAGGTVAVLSPETGMLQGLYSTTHGALETPALRAGTLYTACLPSNANDVQDEVDGALHSIVFGETAVMRLNLDERGRPVADGTQHAVVEPEPDTFTLDRLRLRNSCLEAWINAPVLTGTAAEQAAGGILGIAPSTQTGFGVNLWIDKEGAVRYKAWEKREASWASTEIKVPTRLIDGKWHHLAICRQPDGRAFTCIDGKQVDCEIVTSQSQPAAVSERTLQAFVGACAADDFSATRTFRGMIAEVRVWDAWLPTTEIAARMNVKLRGDEPDLVAWWNFDQEAVCDSAHQGHDGDLAEEPAVPVWWLTDLPFTQPAYPYISTSASIAGEAEGKPVSYQVTVKVCAANGQGLPGEPVKLWYVRNEADEPGSILINSTQVDAVSAGYEKRRLLRAAHNAKAYEGITGTDGTLKVTVTTSVPGHGPAIDMWTDFMPEHLRFHVNVLIDNQTLAKPAPPVLSAQAKLIQDYHYATGGKVNDTRDRSTWRVVLNASEPTGLPRPGEPITVWASQNTTIEIGSKTYSVNQDNSVTVDAEANGELTVVLSADGLTAPALYCRAGFMHRNDRMVINPDQDAHAHLSTLKTSELTEVRSTNWRRGEQKKDSLLKSDYAPHAGDVADAVRKVASSVKPADPQAPKRMRGLTPTRRQLLNLRLSSHHERARLMVAAENGVWSAPRLSFMQQPEPVATTDCVVVRRTLAGVARPAPVDPEAFREALGGALGFVFETDKRGGNFTYTVLHSREEVVVARGVPTPPRIQDPNLTGLFDFWNDIKDAAVSIYDNVKKIVVTIADTVQLAIETVKGVVHKIVDSVKDALDAVAGFFEQLAVAIMKVIEFLRALFDWGNILKTHEILYTVIDSSLKLATRTMRNMDSVTSAMSHLLWDNVDPAKIRGSSLGQDSQRDEGRESDAMASANSVQGKSMMARSSSSPVTVSGGTMPPDAGGDASSLVSILVQGIPELAYSLLDLAPGDLVAKLLDVVKKAVAGGAAQTAREFAAFASGMAEPVEWVRGILTLNIRIPFISELYEWITGRPLSLLSLACLALAIPVNLAYALITGVLGSPGYFFDEAQPIANVLKDRADGVQAAGMLTLHDSPLLPPSKRAAEIANLMLRAMNRVLDLSLDVEFARSITTATWDFGRGIMSLLRGVFGLAQINVDTYLCDSVFVERLTAVVGKDRVREFIIPWEWLAYTKYGVLLLVAGVKCYSGVQSLRGQGASSEALIEFKDKGLTAVCLGVMAYLIYQIATLPGKLEDLREFNVEKITMQYELYCIRDMLALAPLLFEWMYAEKAGRYFAKRNPNPLYGTVTAVRALSDTASIVIGGIAVFEYGDA